MAGADRDQLDRAPGRLLNQAMAALGQRRKRRRGEPVALVIQRVGQPLMVKARHRDGLIRCQPEIGDIG